ncbi:MAG: serine hydrolase, partial [Parabacteroides sp.]|nr:serine hydrolase [Parabacteroides sp.]
MKKKLLFGLCCLGSLLWGTTTAQVYDLPRSTPEAEGVPSKALITVFDSLMGSPRTDIHSFVVMRHGKVISEFYPKPFAIEYKHTMYSCSKTFVSLAVGLAIDENRLRLTDRVATFFIESLPDSISAGLAEMTVEDLLTMRSGIKPDWEMRNKCTDWIRTFLAKPVDGAGEKFGYDSMATYMLSAIVQKVTGMTTLDYLKKKLFKEMHITDIAWELSPEGVNTGGWGLYIQSESLAKFGQLWLNKGKWNGKQLISSSWIEQMSALHVKSNSYGYQIWHCDYPGAVRADGAFGQWVIVVPDKDMVVVITQCSNASGRYQRGLIWNHIVPQLSDTPLALGNDYKRLQEKQR